MSKFKVLDLFSGIGGFSLGLERTGGFETGAFCEIEPFCRKVLAKHWPEVKQYEDVRTLTSDRLRADGIGVDVICGGFPCQDISYAGAGAGLEGERSGLWSEIARLTSELRPRYVIVENVSALLGRGLDRVLGDLAEIGYDAEWHCIPASAVGAPHRRDRIWIMANAQGVAGNGSEFYGEHSQKNPGQSGGTGSADPIPYPNLAGLEGWEEAGNSGKIRAGIVEQFERPSDGIGGIWRAEPDVGQLVDGVPAGLARIRGLTNDQRWLQIPCEETAESCLRNLQKHKKALRSPHRPGLEKQQPIEYSDAVQFLSHIVASCSGGDCADCPEKAMQTLQGNILSSGFVQHASDQAETVWQSLANAEKDWFVMATCLGRNWTTLPIGRVAHGVSKRVDRLKSLGNAVVPQIPELLGNAILAAEAERPAT